jgi:hypothetical protein
MNLTDFRKAHHVGLTLMRLTCCANHGEQFLQYTVNGDETWVKLMTPETKEASMM